MSDNTEMVAARVEMQGAESVEQAEARMVASLKRVTEAQQRAHRVQREGWERLVQSKRASDAAAAANERLAVTYRSSAKSVAMFGASFADTEGIAARFGSIVTNMTPALDGMRTSLAEAAKGGSSVAGVFGKLVPTAEQLNTAFLGLAAGEIVGKGIAAIADRCYKLEGEVGRLNETFDSGFLGENAGEKEFVVSARLDQLNEKIEALSGHVKSNLSDAHAELARISSESAKAADSFTLNLTRQASAAGDVANSLRLAAGSVNLYSLTKEQVADLTKQVKANERAFADLGITAPQSLKGLAAELGRVGALNIPLTHGFQTVDDATAEWSKTVGKLRERLYALEDVSKLTTKGKQDLYKAIVDVADAAEAEGRSLGDVNDELDGLGISVAEARKQLDPLIDTFDALKDAANPEFWMGKKQSAAIHDQWTKNLEAQKAAFKKEADDEAAYHKQKIDEVGDYMEERFGEATRKYVTEWSDQFGTAVARLFDSDYFKAGAMALGGGKRSLRGLSGADATLAGLGLGGDKGSDEPSMKDKLRALDAQIAEKKGTLARLDDYDYVHAGGRPVNREHSDRLGKEIADLEEARKQALGGKESLGSSLNRRFADQADRHEQATGADREIARGLAQMNAKLDHVVTNTAQTTSVMRTGLGQVATGINQGNAIAGEALADTRQARTQGRTVGRVQDVTTFRGTAGGGMITSLRRSA